MNVFNILREKIGEISELVRPIGWSGKIEIVQTKAAIEIINQVEQQCNDGWIPCSSKILPEEHESIFAKWKGTDKWRPGMFEKISNEVNVTVADEAGNVTTHRAHTIDGEWSCDLLKTYKSYYILAWKPFPEPYREDMQQAKKQTNGDRIRSMSDAELTKIIMCPYDTAGEPMDIMPCVTELGTQELVSPESCKRCMMKWLEREVK